MYNKIIEKYPCDTKKELLSRERYYIENNKCVNKLLPIVTQDEKNKYQITYQIEYYKDNKEYKNK